MYLFGYGSLIWKQGFEFEEKIYGYVKGFKRRFWQGSEDNRGAPGAPGRVVSLCKSDDLEEQVWGITFRICPNKHSAVTENLAARETGYIIMTTTFYPADTNRESFELQVYVANEEMPLFLGPAPLSDMAWQIYHAKGESGTNVEYLMKLICYSRQLFPHQIDEHLDQLEKEIYSIAKQKGVNVATYSVSEV